jgi:HK97 family phage prohead protease
MTHAEQVERLAALLDPDTPVAARRRPVKANVPMHRKLVEAVEPQSEVTGAFVALVSDYGVDRQRERFARHAFDKAIAKIAAERRAVPVLYGHDQQSTEAIVGYVPPSGWAATDRGLIAKGQIDVTGAVGLRLYKMLRKGALAWSIGFSITRSTPPRGDSPGVLDEVGEMYELSIVPVPANNRTVTLSLKGEEPPEPPSHTELEARLAREGHIVRVVDAAMVEAERDLMLAVLNVRRNGHEDADKAAGVATKTASTAPVVISTFPVA